MRSVRGLLTLVALAVVWSGLLLWGADSVSNVGSFWDLGIGARPLALGGAFVGLADGGAALLYNAAGLASNPDIELFSSVETRPDTCSYGHISARVRRFGFSVHYLDFGLVPITDDLGVRLGARRYSVSGLLLGGGFSVAKLPMAGDVSVGTVVRILRLSGITDSGDGSGIEADLSLLVQRGTAGIDSYLVSDYRFGLVLRNAFGGAILYKTGREEAFSRTANIGISLEFVRQIIVVVDFEVGAGARLGVEWKPLPVLTVRFGVKDDGVVVPTLGFGVDVGSFTFDYALAAHPYLRDQHRFSLAVRL